MSLRDVARQTFTGADNQTVDVGRVLWFASVSVFLGLTVWTVIWRGTLFQPGQFAMGAASILGAGGAAIGFKARAEPPAVPPGQAGGWDGPSK